MYDIWGSVAGFVLGGVLALTGAALAASVRRRARRRRGRTARSYPSGRVGLTIAVTDPATLETQTRLFVLPSRQWVVNARGRYFRADEVEEGDCVRILGPGEAFTRGQVVRVVEAS